MFTCFFFRHFQLSVTLKRLAKFMQFVAIQVNFLFLNLIFFNPNFL